MGAPTVARVGLPITQHLAPLQAAGLFPVSPSSPVGARRRPASTGRRDHPHRAPPLPGEANCSLVGVPVVALCRLALSAPRYRCLTKAWPCRICRPPSRLSAPYLTLGSGRHPTRVEIARDTSSRPSKQSATLQSRNGFEHSGWTVTEVPGGRASRLHCQAGRHITKLQRQAPRAALGRRPADVCANSTVACVCADRWVA